MEDWWRSMYYKLVGTLPVLVDIKTEQDFLDWAEANEKVKSVAIDTDHLTYMVSTIFLGLDHRLYSPFTIDDADPLLFETMIFPTDSWDYYQERCSTYAQALLMHRRAVEHVAKVRRQLPVVLPDEGARYEE